MAMGSVIISELADSVYAKTEPVKHDYEDFLKNLDKSIEIANGVLQAKILDDMSAIDGLGAFIQAYKKTSYDRPVEKLKELDGIISQIETKMTSFSSSVQAFFTGFTVSLDSVNEILILFRLLRDVLSYENEETLENFRNVYERHSPLDLAYTLLCVFEQKNKTPFVKPTVSKFTIDEVNQLGEFINNAFAQLMFIEAFAAGILKEQNLFTFYKLHEKATDMAKLVETWRKFNNHKDLFVEDNLSSIMETCTSENKKEIADKIAKELETYPTNSPMYVIIVKQASIGHNPNYYGYDYRVLSHWGQIKEIDKNGFVLFVYRSFEANRLFEIKYDGVEKQMKSLPQMKLDWEGSLGDMIHKQIFGTGLFTDDHFIFLAQKECEMEVRTVNCTDAQKMGPGWYTEVPIANTSITMLVGYP